MQRLTIVVSLAALMVSCAQKEVGTHHSLQATPPCDGGHLQMLLQIKPGSNPNGLVYQKEVAVTVDGTLLPQTFTLTNDSPPVDTELSMDAVETGDTFTVAATFTDDSSPPVSCNASWTAVAHGSIGCSPIEIFYQADLGTCLILCN